MKEIILNSNEYKKDPNFVQKILSTVVIERQEREKMKLKFDQEKQNKKENLDLLKKKKLN